MHAHWRKIERISVLLVALVYMPGQQSIAMVSKWYHSYVNSYKINFSLNLTFHCFTSMKQPKRQVNYLNSYPRTLENNERISVLLVALVHMPGQQSIAMVSNVNSYEINFAFKLIFHCFIPMTQKMIFFVISTSCSKYSWSAASSFLN